MQLTKLANVKSKNIIFYEPKDFKVKESKFRYQGIKIETKYANQTKGLLLIKTPLFFSFSVNEKKNQELDKLVGYSVPACLWEKDPDTNQDERFSIQNFINHKSLFCPVWSITSSPDSQGEYLSIRFLAQRSWETIGNNFFLVP